MDPSPTIAAATASPNPSPKPAETPAKGRKGAAAGGGKAWTEEEEVYLLQMRLERVAYKKIASHLDKTELACRLHYHQLSHGGNRRKRNNSISSNASNSSAASPAASPSSEAPSSILPRTSAAATSTPATSFSPVNAHGAVHKFSSTSKTPRTKGKPLLPKPAAHPAARKAPAAQSGRKTPLRVDCSAGGAGAIDTAKLRKIVETHQAQFWDSVAAQYGGQVDGDFLCRVWQQQSGTTFEPATPPTPGISPASNAGSPRPMAAQSPPAEDRTNSGAAAAASEVSTPASSPAATVVAFNQNEGITSIKEDPMEVDRPAEHQEAPRQELHQPMAVAV